MGWCFFDKASHVQSSAYFIFRERSRSWRVDLPYSFFKFFAAAVTEARLLEKGGEIRGEIDDEWIAKST